MQRNHRYRREFHRLIVAISSGVALAFFACLSHAVTLPPLAQAHWIWSQESTTVCDFRKGFILEAAPTHASVSITADNGYELYVNGSLVGSDVGADSDVWQSVERYDITSRLAKGRNIIGIHGIDLGGVRAVIAAVRMEIKGKPLELVTDGTWRVSRNGKAIDYSHPEFVEGPEWSDAKVVGPMGMAPWGRLAWSQERERARSKITSARVELAQPDQGFSWPEGVAFLGDDCSVYVPLRGDAWGVAFRVGDWSRAYTEFDLPCPSKIGRKLYTLTWQTEESGKNARRHPGPLPQERGKDSTRMSETNALARSTRLSRNVASAAMTPREPEQSVETANSSLSPGVRASQPPTSQLRPTPHLRLLLDVGSGVIGSPSASFDGRSLLVAMARAEKSSSISTAFRLRAANRNGSRTGRSMIWIRWSCPMGGLPLPRRASGPSRNITAHLRERCS
jgi:hypothetical protein